MSKQLKDSPEEKSEFGELLKYSVSGYAGGLFLGVLLDHLGFQQSSIGQWLVRTLSGEGESIFEPWIIDWGSRFSGVDVYGVVSTRTLIFRRIL